MIDLLYGMIFTTEKANQSFNPTVIQSNNLDLLANKHSCFSICETHIKFGIN
jgi:hypothetical protein